MSELPDTPSNTNPPADKPARKPQAKSTRRRSRELALQGLYQWLLSGASGAEIEAHLQAEEGLDKCDRPHFDALLHGCIAEAAALDAVLARHVDRKTTALSPVEHAVLMIGAAYGARLGAATLALYALEGVIGLPVFAGFKSGWMLASSLPFVWPNLMVMNYGAP